MTDAPVSVERSETVVICSLDSPDERNAITAAAADRLIDVLDGIEETGARCVLLRGEGDSFCAGGDLRAHVEHVAGDIDQATWQDRTSATAEAVAAVYECPLPTVAAVDGPAFSEGACLALACDLRLASTDGSIGFGFRRFGQAVSAGASYLLPRVVGPDVALELLYTGEMVDARRAADMGLFTRVVPDERFADELASLLGQLSTGPLAAMRETKALCRQATTDLRSAITAEREVRARLAGTAAYEEGVTAFVQQRDPDFRDPA